MGSRDAGRDGRAGERIGIFGGTFDPHVGHLVSAVNVRHELRLDRVLLVVNDVPWQKSVPGRSPRPPTGSRWWRPRSRTSMASRRAGSRSPPGVRRTPPTPWPPCGRRTPIARSSWCSAPTPPPASPPGSASTRCATSPPSWWSSAPGGPSGAGGVALGARRGAEPRGLEHRSAGPRRRRSPARLPGPPRGRRLDRGPRSLSGVR